MIKDMREEIRAGDSVINKRTGEIWYILGVNKAQNRVCVAGYPSITAPLSECKMYKPGNGLDEAERKYRTKEFGTNWDE